MSVLTLPNEARWLVVASAMLLPVDLALVVAHAEADVLLAAAALLVSFFLGDMFTGLAHFSFDYLFPFRFPVFGPIAQEFNEHHHDPDLDPRNYVVNLTKGSYASLPISLLALALWLWLPHTPASFFLTALLAGFALLAFFFHQIHSYCHMGSLLAPETFNRKMLEIAALPSKRDQMRELSRLFDTVPIPPMIRRLQRWRLLLTPESHNLHHIKFESDFSSVNGWSDPVLNPVLGPIARRYKAAAAAAAADDRGGVDLRFVDAAGERR